MFIKTERDGLQAIKTEDMDNVATFSSNNIAQVTKSDGEALLAKHPEIFSEHNP